MPDPNQSDSDLLRAVRRPLVLSIDLIGWELTHPADRLALALNNQPTLYWSIQKVIDKEATRLVTPSFGTFYASGDQAKRIALGTLQLAGEATWKSIQKSPRYKLLDDSLKDLKTTFDKTPTGMFLNAHTGELILVGSLLVVGGAVAQYHFRTSDDVAGLYATAVSAATSKIKIGELSFGASVPSFVPSKGEVGFKAFGGYNFGVVDTRLELGGKVENDKLNAVDGKALVSVPIKLTDIDLKLKGSFGAAANHLNDGQARDMKWKYSLGLDASSKDSRFSAGLLFSGENSVLTLRGGAQYLF